MTESTDVLIKPKISKDEVVSLVKKLYALECAKIVELNGYDDRNFKISVDPGKFDNVFMEKVNENGYILKITNTLDSQKLQFMEASTIIMLHLGNNNISCPKPIKNKNGKYYSLELLSSGRHVVRLLEFVPGNILMNVPSSPRLFYQCGYFAAKIDIVLKTFHHPAYESHKSLWMLDEVPQLKNYAFAIENSKRRQLVEKIIHLFETQVLSKKFELERGLIHGDFNEQNILVNKDELGRWCVTTILDFGDTSISCYLFELAITMTYMMVLNKDMDSGGYVIAGYNKIKPITDKEFSLLKLCILARLCQSLVIGAYSSRNDPGNNYLLTTQVNGWELLCKLWEEPDAHLIGRWKMISDNYNNL